MLVRTVGMSARGYPSARAFLDDPQGADSDCAVLDVRMPGLSGLELQQRFVGRYLDIPIIFVSGHGDIPMAVQAMRQGAIDFLQKPFSEQILLDRIHGAVEISRQRRQTQLEREVWRARYGQLTARECEVLNGIAAGAQNKQMAIDFGISIRTVEQHRAQVMRKMEVRTVAELIAALASLHDDAGRQSR
jgi:FixJ family two-component response regulator